MEPSGDNPAIITSGERHCCATGDGRLRIVQSWAGTGYLKIINPGFSQDWIREYNVSRDKYAQPVCEVGFSKHALGIKTPVKGLYLTDSCQLHPDDRTVSNSIGLGRRVARLVLRSKRAEG